MLPELYYGRRLNYPFSDWMKKENHQGCVEHVVDKPEMHINVQYAESLVTNFLQSRPPHDAKRKMQITVKHSALAISPLTEDMRWDSWSSSVLMNGAL